MSHRPSQEALKNYYRFHLYRINTSRFLRWIHGPDSHFFRRSLARALGAGISLNPALREVIKNYQFIDVEGKDTFVFSNEPEKNSKVIVRIPISEIIQWMPSIQKKGA